MKWITPAMLCLILLGCTEQASEPVKEDKVPLFSNLGDYHFPVSTSVPLAQRYFDQGLTLAYAFNHAMAALSFREAARLDPKCALCYWGAALVLGPNINSPMVEEDAPNAWQAVQKALQLSADPAVSEKERGYIRALAKRYAKQPVEDRSALDRAYAQAMRDLARQYPDDSDVQTLFAEALMDLHPWNYWQKNGEPQPWAPEILSVLEAALAKEPKHIGANHFYIHMVEASPHPERGLASADRLGDLVPGAGHLVHMPAHIYINIGRYHDASLANQRAIEADEAFLAEVNVEGIYPQAYVPHNHHFLWASATMEGNSELAIQAAREAAAQVDKETMHRPGWGALQHYYALPLYALARFGKWQEIQHQPRPEGNLKYPSGVWHYARGLAFVRTKQLEQAAKALEELKAIAKDPALSEVKIWEVNSLSDVLRIAAAVLEGELAAERADYETALSVLRQAVALEDSLNYNEPSDWYYPVRHSLGAVLLEAERPGEAEAVYREDLRRNPQNGWALFGLAQSLRAQGKEASEIERRFKKAWRHADVTLTSSRF